MRQLIAALLFFVVAAQAATEREVAEWVLRWEGSLILEGSNAPIRDVFQLPAGDFHIASIDLTAAVMRPVELRKLEGLTHLRQLYLPGKIWNPGAGNEDKAGVFEALASLTSVERLAFSWHFNSNMRPAVRGSVRANMRRVSRKAVRWVCCKGRARSCCRTTTDRSC